MSILTATESKAGHWFINPPKGKIPAHLRPYLFKKGHGKVRASRKRNPWDALHYPRRAKATVAWREDDGTWGKVGGHAARPARPKNPPLLSVINAKRAKRRNPPGILGKLSGMFAWATPISTGLGIGTGIVADTQLVPRAVGMLPAMADMAKQGIGLIVARALVGLLAVPWLLWRFVHKGFAVGYFGGTLGSLLASGVKMAANWMGFTTLAEIGADNAEVDGNPLGWFGAGAKALPAPSGTPVSAYEGSGTINVWEGGDVGESDNYFS